MEFALCRHAAAVSGDQGHRVRTHAAPSHGHVQVEAEWSDTRGVISADLTRFGHRDRLEVHWRRTSPE